MNEASFASLSPSLLARKGGAKPAMRPQLAPLDHDGAHVAANLEDLGWNDMGDEIEDAASAVHPARVLNLTPEPANEQAEAESRALDKAAQDALSCDPPAVHRQQAELAERVTNAPLPFPVSAREPRKGAPAASGSKATAGRRSARDSGRRAAFTLRLDAERHLKLRLLSTVQGKSAQQIVTDALDSLLDGMTEIETLAAHVKRR